MSFIKAEFEKKFASNIAQLVEAEKITKAVLRDLSRDVLEAHHHTEDVRYINEVVAALTPVNKKVAILFFTEFSGFREEKGIFTKKDKSKYEKAHAAYVAFMEDPNNNIWSWAEKEIDVAQKEFDINMVTKTIERFNKKANDAGMTQADVLRAVFKAGFDMEALLEVMNEVAGIEAPKADEGIGGA